MGREAAAQREGRLLRSGKGNTAASQDPSVAYGDSSPPCGLCESKGSLGHMLLPKREQSIGGAKRPPRPLTAD
ncbi:hypothetical protein GCM10010842_21430 [Deinococcus daejeonensis]|uniref:Uncharacterized protein n=1 Tax=Deinococcus daejeonensis TaxID=1007098 RepID=A0ABQ2J2Q6_9DEIO|nr:hypothetical protein GCM10010842_21430 [Deinococcus daejeonensis]